MADVKSPKVGEFKNRGWEGTIEGISAQIEVVQGGQVANFGGYSAGEVAAREVERSDVRSFRVALDTGP